MINKCWMYTVCVCVCAATFTMDGSFESQYKMMLICVHRSVVRTQQISRVKWLLCCHCWSSFFTHIAFFFHSLPADCVSTESHHFALVFSSHLLFRSVSFYLCVCFSPVILRTSRYIRVYALFIHSRSYRFIIKSAAASVKLRQIGPWGWWSTRRNT